jgi:hypothetical protein
LLLFSNASHCNGHGPFPIPFKIFAVYRGPFLVFYCNRVGTVTFLVCDDTGIVDVGMDEVPFCLNIEEVVTVTDGDSFV